MGVYIPNMEKPKNAFECSTKINPEERMCIYTGKVFEETLSLLLDRPCYDCPIIDIVTCGECIYHDDGICRRPKWAMGVEPTGFCSYGERRK